jgi:membrane fusion protein (multidrug efflux system)
MNGICQRVDQLHHCFEKAILKEGETVLVTGARGRVCSLFVLHFSVCIFTCMTLLFLSACGKPKSAPPQPTVVEVVDVIQEDVPIIHEWVGTADGLVNATIRAQVTGYLTRQDYTEGDLVKKGDVLFEIDPRPFQATLDQTKGILAQMEATYENTEANLARVQPLAAQNALSKKDLDDATAAARSAKAAVVASQAAVEKARLDFGFTKIISPINGMAGIARAQVGDLVGQAVQGGELATVSTINPIKIYYTSNEQAYIDFMKRFSSQAAGLEQARKLEITLILGDGSVYPYKGTFYAIARRVDVRTGTFRVAALFPNPANLLRPGQFARVHVLIGTKKGALLIPQRAVTELQGSYQVAVVGPDNTVDIRTVKPGERYGSQWEIDEGLKLGERVVAEGVQKVKPGMLVNPKPLAPASTAAPTASPKPEDRPVAVGR